MSFSIIVATSKNGIIGVDNQLPWHLPKDLKYFKDQTVGKAVIMGRKTFESLGKPLPNRVNIILTRDKTYKAEGCHVFHSIDDILTDTNVYFENMVIGGGEIYQLFLPYVTKIYHTLVDVELAGDTSFFIPDNFELNTEEKHQDGKLNGTENVTYSFRVLEKKTF